MSPIGDNAGALFLAKLMLKFLVTRDELKSVCDPIRVTAILSLFWNVRFSPEALRFLSNWNLTLDPVPSVEVFPAGILLVQLIFNIFAGVVVTSQLNWVTGSVE